MTLFKSNLARAIVRPMHEDGGRVFTEQ
jgi:hypothetical protein